MDYKIENKNNKRYIVIPELNKLGLRHCFTTIDMDIGLTTNGSVEDINKNLEYIFDYIGVRPKELYSGYQTHSSNIVSIRDLNQGEEYATGRVFQDTDGLATDIKNIALISRYADCTPIILFDPIRKVHVNIHSGWKGTLQRIGANGVDIMIKEYNCNPEDIIAVIGPTIGKNDFEVELDVKTLFVDKFDFHEEIITKKNEIKYLIDLQTTNKKILLESGINEENLTIIDISTLSSNFLHSYRRDKDDFGLMGVITVL